MAEAEIIGPDGEVHYRRPHNHKDVREALSSLGYSVRVPGCGMEVIDGMNLEEGCFYPMRANPLGLLVRSWRGPEPGAHEQWDRNGRRTGDVMLNK